MIRRCVAKNDITVEHRPIAAQDAQHRGVTLGLTVEHRLSDAFDGFSLGHIAYGPRRYQRDDVYQRSSRGTDLELEDASVAIECQDFQLLVGVRPNDFSFLELRLLLRKGEGVDLRLFLTPDADRRVQR